MFVLIKNNIIMSYSRGKMPWGIYTESEWLSWGRTVWEVTKVWQKDNIDIYDVKIKLTKEDLVEIQKEKIEEIEEEFKQTIQTLESGYSEEERQGWELQKTEARKVIAGWTSDILNLICAENGENVSDFANKIKTNSDNLAKAYAIALGIKQKKIKLLG